MKLLPPTLFLLTIGLMSSCGMTMRHVSIEQLEARLQDDTRKQNEHGVRPWYQWSYIGSDHDRHYFRRQVGRMFVCEFKDGIYGIPKTSLNLQHAEFPRPRPDNSARWKKAFTDYDEHGMPIAYGSIFGVENGASQQDMQNKMR